MQSFVVILIVIIRSPPLFRAQKIKSAIRNARAKTSGSLTRRGKAGRRRAERNQREANTGAGGSWDGFRNGKLGTVGVHY